VALPERIRRILPPDTAKTWSTLVPMVPAAAYPGGGTAIAVHLGHRVSRDPDFFYHHAALDLDQIAETLAAAGRFAVTLRAPGTLNGVFSKTKVRFLYADEGAEQHLIATPAKVEGLRIAALEDLIAVKLKCSRRPRRTAGLRPDGHRTAHGPHR
jgi:nucleotidyltransferase AbiEii toxin of type IV toxin-antitoxin system